MPSYNEDDAAALTALLTRYTRLWRMNAADKAAKAEIEARLAEHEVQFSQMRAAFAIFGVTGLSKVNWDQLRQDLGEERYLEALRKASAEAGPKPQVIEGAILPIEQQPEPDTEANKSQHVVSGTVREIVLQQLQDAGDKGAKASDLRKYIEGARGAPLHEKTVGMTLYRLAQDGFARREGRTWFFVSPNAEAKNPGGDTPGPINRNDEKEGNA